jgi:hypothetical protein
MPSESNGSAPRPAQPTTHPELRLALLHLMTDLAFSPAVDLLVAGADSLTVAARVNDLRAVLFPAVDVES